MSIRLKDFLINLIPFKNLRHSLRLKYGDFPYCYLNKDVKICNHKNLILGKYIFVGPKCVFNCEGCVEIGSYTRMGREVLIMTSNHNYKSDKFLPFDECDYRYKTRVGKACWIGSRAIICPGVNIENYSVVAAGSVVTKSVPEGAIVAGNPAKIIGWRNQDITKNLECNNKFATFDDVKDRKWVDSENYKNYIGKDV